MGPVAGQTDVRRGAQRRTRRQVSYHRRRRFGCVAQPESAEAATNHRCVVPAPAGGFEQACAGKEALDERFVRRAQPPTVSGAELASTRQLPCGHGPALSCAATRGPDPGKPIIDARTTGGAAATPSDASLVAIGLRTTIWPGRPSEAALACLVRID